MDKSLVKNRRNKKPLLEITPALNMSLPALQ